jgi:hypothetical protein
VIVEQPCAQVDKKHSASKCRVLCFASTSPFQFCDQPIRGFIPHLHRNMRVDVGESALPPRRFSIRKIAGKFGQPRETIFVMQIVNRIGVLRAEHVHFDHLFTRQ